jgi:ComF family protein
MYSTFFKPLFSDIKTFVLDTLFPISCLSCGDEGEFVCGDCKATMKKLEHQRCIVCQKNTPFGFTHLYCQAPNGADGLVSFYNYHDEKVSKILIAGKYNFLPKVYEILGQMIALELQSNFLISQFPNFYLVPVPLHASRQRWRGFNQAEILCQSLNKNLGLACINVLVRCKITKTQKDLKKDGRLKNVANAFKLKPGADVRNKNIILVDDVTTTGATLQEAAGVLKRNGAAKVICLTVARD